MGPMVVPFELGQSLERELAVAEEALLWIAPLDREPISSDEHRAIETLTRLASMRKEQK